MKKILLYGSTAAVLMLLASCSTDSTEPSAPAVRTITRTFPVNETIGSAHDTRTAYENGQIGFTDNEKLGAYVWSEDPNENATGVTVAIRTPGSPATITVSHDAIANVDKYSYVFVSPYKYNNTPSRTTPTVTLNSIQHPTATTFDSSQDILVSKPVTGPDGATTSPVLEEVAFKRLFTFFRLKINRSEFTGDITLAEGEKIRSVTITAPEGTALAGTAKVTIEEAYDATTCNFTEPSNSVTADYGTDGEAFNADGTFDVWFVVNPVTFNGMTIEVRTSAQTITQTFSELITLDFKASGINTLNFKPAKNTNITTTTAVVPQDYYEEGVEINGEPYSKNSVSRTINKTADAPNTALSLSSTTLVYFLDDGGNPDNSFTIETENIYRENSAIFIGRYADHKTKLVLNNQFHLRNRESGIYAFKNLDIDMRKGSQAQLFTMTNDTGGAKTLIFEDCDITFGSNKSIVAPYSSTKESSYIENIIFRNCRLRYEAGTEGYYALIKLHGNNDKNFLKSGLAGFKTLVLENNVFYSTQGSNVKTAVSILYQRYWEADAASYSLSNLNITCKNNTFIDLISYSSGASNPAGMGSAYFMVDQIGSVEFTGNMLYSEALKYVSIMRVTHDYNTNGPWPSINLDREGNAVYGTNGWKFYFDGTTVLPTPYYPEKGTYPKKLDSPLSEYDPANGIFKVSPAYDGYGSSLLY
ncbi:hypothetical protein [uncultured Alistipes sp.]|uniref:hypothetical protein n=1 Tax=uncultured Alistipes sp. TaxID=538949 RepID=UPI002665AB39|nr:hypothetical protein [uncultured Alistipes sp.]